MASDAERSVYDTSGSRGRLRRLLLPSAESSPAPDVPTPGGRGGEGRRRRCHDGAFHKLAVPPQKGWTLAWTGAHTHGCMHRHVCTEGAVGGGRERDAMLSAVCSLCVPLASISSVCLLPLSLVFVRGLCLCLSLQPLVKAPRWRFRAAAVLSPERTCSEWGIGVRNRGEESRWGIEVRNQGEELGWGLIGAVGFCKDCLLGIVRTMGPYCRD